MRRDLDEILDAYGSDKQSKHGYAPIYHALFKHLRDRSLALLEIGIGTVTPGVCSSMMGITEAGNFNHPSGQNQWNEATYDA